MERATLRQFSVRLAIAALPLLLLAGGCQESGTGPRASAGGSPQDAMASYVKGAQALQAGRTADAERDLRAAIAANPNLTMAQVRLADLYRQRGQYERASEHYAAATKLDPYGFSNHYYLGLSLHLLNRLQEAATSYLRALKLEPRDAPANMNLGLVFVALGKPEDGEKYIQKATQINDKSGPAFANLGVALDAQGKYKEAEIAYRKALELDSDDPATLLNLGTNLTLQDKPADAIPILQRALKISDTPLAHRRLAEALMAGGKLDDAIAQFDESLKLNSTYYLALNGKANAYIARYQRGLQLDEGLKAKALESWRRSLEINPNQQAVVLAIDKWKYGNRKFEIRMTNQIRSTKHETGAAAFRASNFELDSSFEFRILIFQSHAQSPDNSA